VKSHTSTGLLVGWLCFALGVLVGGYGIVTGGGLAGVVLQWELQRFGAVNVYATHWFLVSVLVLPSVLALVPYYQKHLLAMVSPEQRAGLLIRGGLVAAAIFLAIGGAALWQIHALPDPTAAPRQLIVGDLTPETKAPEYRAILVGAVQRQYLLEYGEWVGGRSPARRRQHRIHADHSRRVEA
jgi:hypothetical protein